MNDQSQVLRVGRIVALNMYPVYHALEAARLEDVQFTDGLPSALNRALLSTELDVSAMSSIEYARNADSLTLLPIGSITAAGAVDSIQLFSRVPFDRVERVAVTSHSASSVALLRVLIGPDVPFVPLQGATIAQALQQVDGVLLIADEALQGVRAQAAPFTTDLGERWQQLTGLPMVFAVWAARTGAIAAHADRLERLGDIIRGASRRHATDPEPLVQAAAARFPFPADFIRHYFTRLSYDFGDAERAGLRTFFERAHDAGELATIPPVTD